MKKIASLCIILATAATFVSCKDATLSLLCKKWDCVKVDNLDPVPKHFSSPEDSVATMNMQQALSTLSWTFNENKEYQCSVDGRVTTSGSYGLLDKGKTLVCTSGSTKTINIYSISTLTEDDLVLSNRSGNANIVMHFKPH
jgi:hypothetical protein